MDEALSKCRSWTPPQASGFTHTECGVINTDNGSHWKQHMAIMQTVDVLVGAHIGVLRRLVDTEGGREGTLVLGLPLPKRGAAGALLSFGCRCAQRADARSLLSCGCCWNQRGAAGSCLCSWHLYFDW